MGIVLAEAVDRRRLERCLEERGWRPARIGGQPGYEKEAPPWVWLARLSPRVEFLSWVPDDDQAHRHAEGLRRLRREVEEIAGSLDIRLASSLDLYLDA